MKSRIITPKVGFEDDDGFVAERICFPMRPLSLLENNEFWQRFGDIADTLTKAEKADREYEILVDALASWSVQMPFTRTYKKDSKDFTDTPLDDVDTPDAAVRKFFKEKTVDTEKIAHAAVSRFNAKDTANTVF